MTPAELRACALANTDAAERYPFDPETSVFRIGDDGKIFAIARLDDEPLTVSVKCDPDEATALRATYAGIVPGYHLNKRHWITITVGDDVPDSLVAELVEGSYELVHPRRRRA